ncbi:LysR family transcriptional regulator [Rhizobium calliandrae]|uniref:LysR family transcriptional regulator n=1 Tax=Rhizobium calliandrae TaxID=1312182 RepID=A0ABT7KJ13_9HYPH|nr:LysR family transcriptional regulator [Rhizobium calliandrae]MDL2408629.1 LysR family transcriptional regulator [Rhizobium calliandrae]
MQNLEPLLIFTTVAEMERFTRAADSLGIQKERASTVVRKLEEDVGVRLLHCSERGTAALALLGAAWCARSGLPYAIVLTTPPSTRRDVPVVAEACSEQT